MPVCFAGALSLLRRRAHTADLVSNDRGALVSGQAALKHSSIAISLNMLRRRIRH